MTNPLSNDLDHILSKTKNLWQELRGKRIFLTGGTGFFGCWLLESFCWANRTLGLNAEAWILTRNPDAFRKKCPHLANDASLKLYKGNCVDFDFPPEEFSHLIHASVYNDSTKDGENSEKHMLESMLGGLQHTLEFAAGHGVRKALLTSTGAIYGKPPRDQKRIPEDFSGDCDPSDVQNVYRETRRIMETICTVYARRHSMQVKIARGFAFVGPYLPLSGPFAAGNFIQDALNGRPILVKGDGSPFRSYMYAADMAVWLWTILFCGESCRPYNVGSEEPVTIYELACCVARGSSPKVPVTVAGKPTLGENAEFYVPDTGRARIELGLNQEFLLFEGIQKTIAWNKWNLQPGVYDSLEVPTSHF